MCRNINTQVPGTFSSPSGRSRKPNRLLSASMQNVAPWNGAMVNVAPIQMWEDKLKR